MMLTIRDRDIVGFKIPNVLVILYTVTAILHVHYIAMNQNQKSASRFALLVANVFLVSTGMVTVVISKIIVPHLLIIVSAERIAST